MHSENYLVVLDLFFQILALLLFVHALPHTEACETSGLLVCFADKSLWRLTTYIYLRRMYCHALLVLDLGISVNKWL